MDNLKNIERLGNEIRYLEDKLYDAHRRRAELAILTAKVLNTMQPESGVKIIEGGKQYISLLNKKYLVEIPDDMDIKI